jgi:hypothetical protein
VIIAKGAVTGVLRVPKRPWFEIAERHIEFQMGQLGPRGGAMRRAGMSRFAQESIAWVAQISSGTRSMAPQGHSCTQSPQPLQ